MTQDAIRLGVAVIGAGRIGTLRARLAARHPAVGFMAIADLDPLRAKALAEVTGADFHTGSNVEAIERPEVNAVFVSTPESLHSAPVRRALELGKPVRSGLPAASCASATAGATRNAFSAPRSR
jgi:myo-inositol 2-dehydrogenase/D-chiro-inositol 1-dehydrogenase